MFRSGTGSHVRTEFRQRILETDRQPNRLPYLDVVFPLLDSLEALAAFLAGELVVADAPTEGSQILDIVLALPLVDLVTDGLQFGGELVKRVPLGEVTHLPEKPRDRIGPVAGAFGTLDGFEITLLDHSREVLDGSIAGDVRLGGDPAGVPRLRTGERDVADALDLAHRSVQRNLADLADRGWVEKRDGAYHLTTTGRLVTRTHAEYVRTLDRLDEWEPFVGALPDASHVPDPDLLADATLVGATAADPQAPVNHYVRTVRRLDTTRVRMVSPVLSRLFHDEHADLVARGVSTELVMATDTVRAARDLNPAEFAVVLRVPKLRLYRHPGPVDVGVTLADDRVLVGAYDDDGQLVALLDGESPELLEWAADLYDRYRADATRVRPGDPLPGE